MVLKLNADERGCRQRLAEGYADERRYLLSRVSPWLFVPTLYFAEGVPYVVINYVSVIFYKQLGVDNAQTAFWTSFLYLPWVLKMLWGPIVDGYATKRKWTIYTQAAMFVCLLGLAFSLQLFSFFWVSLLILAVGALISATHDIAADGFYMLSLERDAQAFFVGIRSTFYRLATIFAAGIVVFLAGQLEIKLDNIALGWTIAIALSAFIFAAIAVFHWFALPIPVTDTEKRSSVRSIIDFYGQAVKSYFSQPKILAILAFILFYRFGEGMLVKISTPFLLDKTTVGGLGLSTSDVGLVYGTVGTFALVLGGIIGGVFIAEFELKKVIWWMAIALNLPNLFYVYLAYTQPAIELVYMLVAVEQFGYGLGMAAYSVYLIYIAQEEYKTSHFAISTGIMALGMMLPGFISGYLQQVVGYPIFFILVCLLAIPGILTLYFIPLNLEKSDR